MYDTIDKILTLEKQDMYNFYVFLKCSFLIQCVAALYVRVCRVMNKKKKYIIIITICNSRIKLKVREYSQNNKDFF